MDKFKSCLLTIFLISLTAISTAQAPPEFVQQNSQSSQIITFNEETLTTEFTDNGVKFKNNRTEQTVSYKDVFIPEPYQEHLNGFSATYKSPENSPVSKLSIDFSFNVVQNSSELPRVLDGYSYQLDTLSNPAQTKYSIQSSMDISDNGNGTSMEEDADYDMTYKRNGKDITTDGSLNRKINGTQILNDAPITQESSAETLAFDLGLINTKASTYNENLVIDYSIHSSVRDPADESSLNNQTLRKRYGRQVTQHTDYFPGEEPNISTITNPKTEIIAESGQTLQKLSAVYDNKYDDEKNITVIIANPDSTQLSSKYIEGRPVKASNTLYNEVKQRFQENNLPQSNLVGDESQYNFHAYNVTANEDSQVNIEANLKLIQDRVSRESYMYVLGSIGAMKTSLTSTTEWEKGTFTNTTAKNGDLTLFNQGGIYEGFEDGEITNPDWYYTMNDDTSTKLFSADDSKAVNGTWSLMHNDQGTFEDEAIALDVPSRTGNYSGWIMPDTKSFFAFELHGENGGIANFYTDKPGYGAGINACSASKSISRLDENSWYKIIINVEENGPEDVYIRNSDGSLRNEVHGTDSCISTVSHFNVGSHQEDGDNWWWDSFMVPGGAKTTGSYTSKVYNRTGFKDYTNVTVNTSYSTGADVDLVFKGLYRNGSLKEQKVIDLSQGENTYDLSNLEGEATQYKVNGTVQNKGDSFTISNVNWDYQLVPSTTLDTNNHWREGSFSDTQTSTAENLTLKTALGNLFEGFEAGSLANWSTSGSMNINPTSAQYEGSNSAGSWGDGTMGAEYEICTGGCKPDSIEVYWYESSSQTGHAFPVRDSQGNLVHASGNNNPQWEIKDGDGSTTVFDGNGNYNDWIKYNFTYNWEACTYDYYMQNTATGTDRSGTRSMDSCQNIETFQFNDDYFGVSANHIVIDNFQVTGVPVDGGGFVESGSYASETWAFNDQYTWGDLEIDTALPTGTDVNATFRAINDDGTVAGTDTVQPTEGTSNYSISVPDTRNGQLYINGSTTDTSNTFQVNSATIHEGSGSTVTEPSVTLENPADNTEVGNPVTFDFTPQCFTSNGCNSATLYMNTTSYISEVFSTDTNTEWNEGALTQTEIKDSKLQLEGGLSRGQIYNHSAENLATTGQNGGINSEFWNSVSGTFGIVQDMSAYDGGGPSSAPDGSNFFAVAGDYTTGEAYTDTFTLSSEASSLEWYQAGGSDNGGIEVYSSSDDSLVCSVGRNQDTNSFGQVSGCTSLSNVAGEEVYFRLYDSTTGGWGKVAIDDITILDSNGNALAESIDNLASSGDYTSKVFEAEDVFDWSSKTNISTPSNTNADLDYGTNNSGSWTYYDTVSELPESKYARFKASLSTSGSNSPSIDYVDLTASGLGPTWSPIQSTTSVQNDTVNSITQNVSKLSETNLEQVTYSSGGGVTGSSTDAIDGFEDGNLDEWTLDGVWSTTTNVAYSGSYSALGESSGVNENMYYDMVDQEYSSLQVAFRPHSFNGNSRGELDWQDTNNNNFGRDPGITISFNEGSGFNINTDSDSADLVSASNYNEFTWYFIEIKDINYDTNNIGEVYVDGDLKAEDIAFDGNTIKKFQAKVDAANSHNINVDDVKVAKSNEKPVINSAGVTPQSWSTNKNIDVFADASDPDNNLQSVTATVWKDGTEIASDVSLSDGDSDGNYTGTDVFSPSDSGEFVIGVNASDDAGAWNYTNRTYNFTKAPTLPETFDWNVQVNDSAGNSAFADQNRTVTVSGNEPPNEPTLVSPADGSLTTTSPTLEVDATDPDGDDLDVTLCLYPSPGGSCGQEIQGTTATLSDLTRGTTVRWYAIADDGQETTESPTWSFDVNRQPSINSFTVSPDPFNIGDTLDYSGEGEDLDGNLDKFTLNVLQDGSEVYQDTHTFSSTSSLSRTWTNTHTAEKGAVSAKFTATDSLGASTTEWINRTIEEDIPPTVSDLTDNLTDTSPDVNTIQINASNIDNETGLHKALLATNETGQWENKTAAFQPPEASYTGETITIDQGDFPRPTGMTWNETGSGFVVSDGNTRYLSQYSCTTNFNISSCSYVRKTTAWGTGVQGISWGPNGDKLFTADQGGQNLNEYHCSTSYKVDTCSQDSRLNSVDITPTDIAWGDNGNVLIEAGADGDRYIERTCGTGYDISTCDTTNNEINSQDVSPEAVTWSKNGERLLTVDGATNEAYEWSCSTSFDIASCSYTGDSKSINGNTATGIEFSNEGDTMHIVDGGANERIKQYSLNMYNSPFYFDGEKGINVTSSFNWDNASIEGEIGYRVYTQDKADNWGVSETRTASLSTSYSESIKQGVGVGNNQQENLNMVEQLSDATNIADNMFEYLTIAPEMATQSISVKGILYDSVQIREALQQSTTVNSSATTSLTSKIKGLSNINVQVNQLDEINLSEDNSQTGQIYDSVLDNLLVKETRSQTSQIKTDVNESTTILEDLIQGSVVQDTVDREINTSVGVQQRSNLDSIARESIVTGIATVQNSPIGLSMTDTLTLTEDNTQTAQLSNNIFRSLNLSRQFNSQTIVNSTVDEDITTGETGSQTFQISNQFYENLNAEQTPTEKIEITSNTDNFLENPVEASISGNELSNYKSKSGTRLVKEEMIGTQSFENGEAEGWQDLEDNDGISSTYAFEGNKSLRVVDDNNELGDFSGDYIQKNTQQMSPNTLHYALRMNEGTLVAGRDNNVTLKYLAPDGSKVIRGNLKHAENTLNLCNGRQLSAQDNKWYNLTYTDIDWSSNTYDLHVNSQKQYNDVGFCNPADSVSSIKMSVNAGGYGGVKGWADWIKTEVNRTTVQLDQGIDTGTYTREVDAKREANWTKIQAQHNTSGTITYDVEADGQRYDTVEDLPVTGDIFLEYTLNRDSNGNTPLLRKIDVASKPSIPVDTRIDVQRDRTQTSNIEQNQFEYIDTSNSVSQISEIMDLSTDRLTAEENPQQDVEVNDTLQNTSIQIGQPVDAVTNVAQTAYDTISLGKTPAQNFDVLGQVYDTMFIDESPSQTTPVSDIQFESTSIVQDIADTLNIETIARENTGPDIENTKVYAKRIGDDTGYETILELNLSDPEGDKVQSISYAGYSKQVNKKNPVVNLSLDQTRNPVSRIQMTDSRGAESYRNLSFEITDNYYTQRTQQVNLSKQIIDKNDTLHNLDNSREIDYYVSQVTKEGRVNKQRNISDFSKGIFTNTTTRDNKLQLQTFIKDGFEYNNFSEKWVDVEGSDAIVSNTAIGDGLQEGNYAARVTDNNNDLGGTGDIVERKIQQEKPKEIEYYSMIGYTPYLGTAIKFFQNGTADGETNEDTPVVTVNRDMGSNEYTFCGINTGYPLEPREWQKVKINDFNWDQGTADFYIDNEKLLDDAELCTSPENMSSNTIDTIRINAQYNGGSGSIGGHSGWYDGINITSNQTTRKEGEYSSETFSSTAVKYYEDITATLETDENIHASLTFETLDSQGNQNAEKQIELDEGTNTYDLDLIQGKNASYGVDVEAQSYGENFNLSNISWNYKTSTEIEKHTGTLQPGEKDYFYTKLDGDFLLEDTNGWVQDPERQSTTRQQYIARRFEIKSLTQDPWQNVDTPTVQLPEGFENCETCSRPNLDFTGDYDNPTYYRGYDDIIQDNLDKTVEDVNIGERELYFEEYFYRKTYDSVNFTDIIAVEEIDESQFRSGGFVRVANRTQTENITYTDGSMSPTTTGTCDTSNPEYFNTSFYGNQWESCNEDRTGDGKAEYYKTVIPQLQEKQVVRYGGFLNASASEAVMPYPGLKEDCEQGATYANLECYRNEWRPESQLEQGTFNIASSDMQEIGTAAGTILSFLIIILYFGINNRRKIQEEASKITP